MNRFVLWFVKLTGYPIQFFYFRKKIYYEDKKSQSRKIKGGALIVSNHTSLFDYPLIMYTFLARSIRTVASEILYNKGKLMAWFLNKIGCIKADRDTHDFSFMSTMNKYLKKKQVGLVFPEARLPREGETELLEFKPSFVYMALEAHVPIIPVYTNGVYGKEKKRKGNAVFGATKARFYGIANGYGPDAYAPEYSYLKGDITKAYTSKVKDVRRSFVFLNLEPKGNADLNPEGAVTDIPAVMIVYDHVVSADPSFRKYWLLHSIEEPQTGTQEFTVARTKDGDTGKLHCSVLLPEADVTKVGGPGKEFWVFGENYPNAATTRPDPCNERGEWRVEVTPKTAAAEDSFLTVMQVMDNAVSSLPVQRIDGDKVVGAVVCGRVVMFRRDSGQLSESFSFEVPKSAGKKVKVLLTDLAEGSWTIKRNGKVFKADVTVTAEEGCIYFDATPGQYCVEVNM